MEQEAQANIVAKIDKNNYFTVSASTDGTLIFRANLLHNKNGILLIKFNKQSARRKDLGSTHKGQ